MSGPSDNAPRWQPPPESTEDTPRWEPPPATSEVPRWDPATTAAPAADVPRWEPERDVPRWSGEAGPVGARFEPGMAPTRRAAEQQVSVVALPFVWWSAHPWVVVWAVVFGAPGMAVLLRVADENDFERFVSPLGWAYAALFGVALLLGARASATRSAARLALGVVTAVLALGVLMWPVTQVTMGRTSCPERARADLGVQTATGAVEAWKTGEGGDAGWRGGTMPPAWRDRARATTLQEYQFVESGCWERLAPVSTRSTWHEFRVTVQDGESTPLLKTLLVSTAAERDGWKITAIEGPLP